MCVCVCVCVSKCACVRVRVCACVCVCRARSLSTTAGHCATHLIRRLLGPSVPVLSPVILRSSDTVSACGWGQAVEGFEGGGIKGQLERLKGQQAERSDQSDLSRAAATAGGQRPASLALARAATQRFGVAGAYDVRLPALTTEAIVFGSHGYADEVCRAEPAWPLGRVLRYGEVLVKMIAAPLTETDLRWIDSSAAGVALPAIAGHDGVGIVVATSKCVFYPPCLPYERRRSWSRSATSSSAPRLHAVSRVADEYFRL